MGVFQSNVFQNNVFQGPHGSGGGGSSGGATSAGGAGGGGALAWRKHWDDELKRREARNYALERVLESAEYRRLKRKLEMAKEMSASSASLFEERKAERMIDDIKKRMQTLEMSAMD